MLMQAEGHTMLLLQSKHNASLERERERERDGMQKEMRGVKQEDILWQGGGHDWGAKALRSDPYDSSSSSEVAGLVYT